MEQPKTAIHLDKQVLDFITRLSKRTGYSKDFIVNFALYHIIDSVKGCTIPKLPPLPKIIKMAKQAYKEQQKRQQEIVWDN